MIRRMICLIFKAGEEASDERKWEKVRGSVTNSWLSRASETERQVSGDHTPKLEISGLGTSPHPEIPKAKILEVSVWLIWWQTLTWSYF